MSLRKFLAAALLVLTTALPASAAVNFPSALDDDTTLFNVANGQVYIAQMHNNPKDAILALEAKVGADGSSVVTSLDYLVKNVASVDPGHSHSGTSISFSDGSAGTPGLRFGNPVTDTTTGLFHPGTGIIAFSSSGAEIWRSSATGFGIFTTAFFPLDVAGTVRIQGANDLCFGGSGGADNDTCLERTGAHVLRVNGSLTVADQATTDNTLVLHGIAAKTGEFIRLFALAADANPIVEVTDAGVINFGVGGATAVDTNLFRSAIDTLRTDDNFIVGGGLTVNADSTLADGVDIAVNATTGTKIGTATSQKLGFFNATPVVQPVASTALITALQNLGFIASGTYSGGIETTGTVTTGGLVGGLQSIALANGANSNVALNAGTTHLRITGPTGVFNITGFTGGTDGRVLTVMSTVSQTLTWTNDATSTANNRLLTQTLADVACNTTEPASAVFVYDGTTSRWRAVSYVNCTNP